MTTDSEPKIELCADAESDLLILPLFSDEERTLPDLPSSSEQTINRALAAGWEARREEARLLGGEGGSGPVLLLGLGSRGAFDAVEQLQVCNRAIEHGRRLGVTRFVVAPPNHPVAQGSEGGERLARGLQLAAYRFNRFKSAEPTSFLEGVGLLVPPQSHQEWEEGIRRAATTLEGIRHTRDLANTPPNQASPRWMAERARELAEEGGFRATLLGAGELEELGAGGILAVGSGSRNPPCLLHLERGEEGPAVALVGKGVTFDTGGISLKPPKAMDEMKYDKSGACTALGAALAAAAAGLPLRLSVWLPLAENMPDGNSYRPGDILQMYSGKTVEIDNTDAEGRLILADALALAAERSPDYLLEYSTLTGAAVVALGHAGAALYSPSEAMSKALAEAAENAGERLWRMPLWPEYRRKMKGSHADLTNSAGRWGAANTAAAFLSHFVGDLTEWAHLDIAGTAYVGADGKGRPGATGWGVATTLAWLRRLLEEAPGSSPAGSA